MKLKILAAGLLFLPIVAVSQDGAAHGATESTESKCVLATARNGQTLTVKGGARSTAHDLVFDIPGCGDTVLLTFAGEEGSGLSSSELRQDKELKRFKKYTNSVYESKGSNICMACAKYGDVEAELTGKLDVAQMPSGSTKDLLGFIRDGSGKIIGKFGWGHPVPFASYRLVIQSVTDVKAKKLSNPV